MPLKADCVVRAFSCTGLHYGWVVISCAALLFWASTPGHSFAVAPFVDSWLVDLKLTRVELSGYWLLATVVSALLLPVVGMLIDHVGPRCVLVIVFPFCVGVTVWLSLMQKGWELALALIASRIVNADALPLIAQVTMASWFVQRLGKANVLLAATNTSMSAFPLFATALITWTGSWRTTYQLLAVWFGIMLLTCVLLLRGRPEDVALARDLEWEASEAFNGGADDQEARPLMGAPLNWTYWEALGSCCFWVIMFQCMANSWWVGMGLHLFDICATLGLGIEAAGWIFLDTAVVSLIVDCIVGFFILDGCTRPHLLMVPGNIFGIIGLLLLTFVPQLYWLAAVAIGAAFGFSSTVIAPILAKYYGSEHLGKIQGTVNGWALLFSGIAPGVFALASQHLGPRTGYRTCFLVYAVFNGAVGIAALITPRPWRELPSGDLKHPEADGSRA